MTKEQLRERYRELTAIIENITVTDYNFLKSLYEARDSLAVVIGHQTMREEDEARRNSANS